MKISWVFVICLGIALSGIALALGYSRWEPTMKEVDYWNTYRKGLQAELQKRPQVDKRILDAEAMAKAEVEKWGQIEATRTLPSTFEEGGADLSMNGWQLVIKMPIFRNSMQKMLNTQVKAGGVRVIQGPSIPLAPDDPGKILGGYFNYPVLPPVVIFDLGAVTVEGTYQQICDNMRAWSRMPHFLAVADGLRLQGTSPKLTGTYAVSIVGFLQTDPTRPIFPPIPDGGRITVAPAAASPGGADITGQNKGVKGGAGNPAGQGAAGANAKPGQAPGANRPAGQANAAGGANRPGGPGAAGANATGPGARGPAANPAIKPSAGANKAGAGGPAGQAAAKPAGPGNAKKPATPPTGQNAKGGRR